MQRAPLLPVPLRSLLLACTSLLLVLLFAERFRGLLKTWTGDDNYSHGFLVPLVSGYLAWRVARDASPPGRGEPVRGLAWLVLGGLCHLAAAAMALAPLDYPALAALLYGVAVCLGGRAWARKFFFPIGFLLFAFPLPLPLTSWVGIHLQGIVSELATRALQLVIPAHRQGYWIHLPGQQLEVGDACSGLRQVVVFAALALLVAYLTRRSWWARGLLVLAAVPVAIAANLLRVLLMAGLVLWFGPGALEGAYHTLWGLLTMGAGLVLFLGVSRWLAWILPEAPREAVTASSDEMPARGWFVPLGTALSALAVLFGVQSVLQAHLNADVPPEPPYLRRSLAALPTSLERWAVVPGASVRQSAGALASELERRTAAADDHLDRVYGRPGDSTTFQLWMIHYRDGQDRLHHPLVCYAATGLPEDRAARQTLSVPGRPEPIQCFCFGTGERRTWVYYWHYTFEPADDHPSFLRMLHRSVTRRLPSLTVEVFTTAAPRDAADFVRQVDAKVLELVPAGARRGSDTLPVQLQGQ